MRIFWIACGMAATLSFAACSSSSSSAGESDVDGGGSSSDSGVTKSSQNEAGSAHDAAAESASDAALDAGDAPWTSVSFGITGKKIGAGNNIAIVYGGYTATDAESQSWVTALVAAKLSAFDVGRIYAVRGPEDADYASREIGNSTLAAALATQTAASDIIVIAHSSGGFVADELFTFASDAVLAKVAYFNLDGGSYAMTSAMVAKMKGVYICDAHDPVAGNSENTSSDENLHADLVGHTSSRSTLPAPDATSARAGACTTRSSSTSRTIPRITISRSTTPTSPAVARSSRATSIKR